MTERGAAAYELAAQQDAAALELKVEVGRTQAARETARALLVENAFLKREILSLRRSLDQSICTDNVPQFWLDVLRLYEDGNIRDPDITLLEHLSARMTNARGQVCFHPCGIIASPFSHSLPPCGIVLGPEPAGGSRVIT